MKVIDVLNMLANDEDVKFKDEKGYFASIRTLLKNLNSEVELIEASPKKDKKIEKLHKISVGGMIASYPSVEQLVNKINEIIDRVNSEDE